MIRPILTTAAAILIAAPANADQAPCAPYEMIAATLGNEYSEAPVATMLSNEGVALVLFASADGSTYTLLAVSPNGAACVASLGTTFSFTPANDNAKPGVNS